MDDLRRLFHEAVTSQISRLDAALAELRAGSPAAEDKIRHLAMAIKGSGASCGFPEVSEFARTAETADLDYLPAATERLLGSMRAMAATPVRKTILIVDDDPLISRLLEMRLVSPERRIVSVDTLTGARTRISEPGLDVVILDLFLPDGDGRTLLAELRADERTAGLPVIVISGSEGLRAECETLGADGFVEKPFDPETVSALVSTTLMRPKHLNAAGSRSELMSTFRQLLATGDPISVTALVGETHGPGGRKSDGPDPRVAPTIVEEVRRLLPPGAVIGEWAEGEPAVIAPSHISVMDALDRARLRLRNVPHPAVPGALISFSAATITDDGSGGLGDAYARARQFALDANRNGGDRIIAPSGERRTKRALLAEDDTSTAALIIDRLEREGYEVEHHPDGVSALEAAERSGYGLVVIDVNLRGFNGFEVLQRLRSSTKNAGTPIVVIASVGNERDVVRGFELGADDYILKPFSPNELTTRLKRFTRS